MKIGIDCRIYGPKHTGIGRYVQNLVENLMQIDKENEYVLFANRDSEEEFENLKFDIKNSLKIKNLKFKIEFVNVKHYSLKEQLLLPGLIKKDGIDLMHFPHFNVPFFYKGKYIVTIHDLIKHASKGRQTTTRSSWLYWFKYLGYKIVFRQAIKRATKIITPSQFVKSELSKEYGIDQKKVMVIYEGVDPKFIVHSSLFKKSEILGKYKIKKPFLLYVGSVYPHKNIERLLEATKSLQTTDYRLQLVIVCARNVFFKRLSNKIEQMRAGEYVKMTGFVSDEELAVLFKEAEAFVFPTLSEGFGLPGLEAMSIGCPVLCSDIPVLREVYKDNAVYFNPFDPKDIAGKIKNLMSDKNLQEKLRMIGPEHTKKYSWKKTAEETLKIFNSIAKFT